MVFVFCDPCWIQKYFILPVMAAMNSYNLSNYYICRYWENHHPLSPLHNVNEHWNRRIHFSGTVLIPSPVASGFWVIPSLLSGFSWKRDGRHFSFYIRQNFICEKVALSVWQEPEFGRVPCSQVKKHAAKSAVQEILTTTHTPYHLLDFETHWESTAHLDVHSS